MHTMPIDPSISLNVQQFDPMAAYGKAMQLSSLLGQQRLQGVQIDHAEREQRDAVKMAEVFKRNINPDGSLNRTKLIQETADAGLGNKIPGMQKQWNEADKADADLRYTNSKTKDIDFGLLKKRLGATNGALASLLSRRDFTYQDVLAQVNRLVDDKVITPEEGATVVRDIPDRPDLLRPYLVQKGIEGLETEKRLELLTPKLERVNNGKTTSFVDTNKWTNPDGPAPIRMTTTPGEDQSAATSRRGQDIQAQTSRRGQDLENARAGTAVEKDASGNLMLVNKSTGASRPITGANGKPLNLGMGQADAKEALNLISQAEPLLRSSTGSWAGKGLDVLAAGFGFATPGSITAGKLKSLEGALVSKMPKMSGPQSDKDVAMYRQMAGEIGDDTVPYARKLAALDTIREIQERHAGMQPGSSRTPIAQQAPAAQQAAKPAALPGGWSVTEH